MPTKGSKSIFNKFWIKGLGIAVNHVVAALTIVYYWDVSSLFYVLALLSGFLNMLGITAGYHRLWSHKCFTASTPLKYLLAVLGAASWQGSIRWWVLRHRMHHRFVDTDFDPYDSTRGLWFSHFGWLFERPKFYAKTSVINMSDLDADPVVEWNRRYTPQLVITLGLILPTLIGYRMGDSLAGFLYIGVLGRTISWNGIFAINSIAHYEEVGEKPYAVCSSATTSFLVALISNGEGNHNYHHEFPYDYRHGVRQFDYDPTKWFIWVCSVFGLCHSLVTVEDHVRLQREKQVIILKKHMELDRQLSAYNAHMGKASTESKLRPNYPNVEKLPVLHPDDFVTSNKALIYKRVGDGILGNTNCDIVWMKIDDFLVDVSAFKTDHPGGDVLLKGFHLKDATDQFRGGRNMHTKAAENIAKRLIIANFSNTAPRLTAEQI